MEDIKFKQLAYDLKDLDTTKGEVIAYANAYNNEDSDRDISVPGSFDKTVSENFKRIRVLKDHVPTMMIGVPLSINTKDSYGLLTHTKFNLDTSLGKDMFSNVRLMHENGLNAELSIGYNVMKRDQKNKALITELLTKAYNLPYSDSRLMRIETILKSLSNEPSEDDTLIDKPIILDTLKSFTQSLNLK
jgi:HK97 family phage prohead protease